MPSFTKGPAYRDTFGANEFLRSTQDVKTESHTFAAATLPTIDVDDEDVKVLQPGVVLAVITSGDDEGKVGPFQAGVSDGRQTAANVVGINNTFLPWQLNERDVEVAVVVEARVYQNRCYEYEADGDRVELGDTVAAHLVAKKGVSILFSTYDGP